MICELTLTVPVIGLPLSSTILKIIGPESLFIPLIVIGVFFSRSEALISTIIWLLSFVLRLETLIVREFWSCPSKLISSLSIFWVYKVVELSDNLSNIPCISI